jgi:hypothetical protein
MRILTKAVGTMDAKQRVALLGTILIEAPEGAFLICTHEPDLSTVNLEGKALLVGCAKCDVQAKLTIWWEDENEEEDDEEDSDDDDDEEEE